MTDSRMKGLPGGIRFAAMVGMVFSAFTGWSALREAFTLARFFESRSLTLEQAESALKGETLELYRRLMETYFAAMEPLHEPRVVLMALLTVTCSFVFVASGRLLRPYGLRRDGMRRVLGRAAILTAVLRTIDGAQLAAVARRMGSTMAASLDLVPNLPPDTSATEVGQALPGVFVGGSVIFTLLVAGTFAILGQYFRSESVREAVAVQDGPQEE
ncbi:hypothetical protein [Comamonas sp. JC664]|uniref:hypothetical protein n=1 Tax=Comamonas sp. JC664 TaxID=2801917 RepID=UPI00174C6B72|nr:hypothetical protein [Comamonas sp. JC664]GHG81625.1 hypothetical protein GCM10012319_35070 [Comamonas sp. KCTC 72670]